MKMFYRFTFILSLMLLILLSFMDIAVPSNVSFAGRLARNPEKWELKLSDSGAVFSDVTPETAKSRLLSFIEQNKQAYATQDAWILIGLLVAALFSLIGWIREKSIENQKIEPCGPANAIKLPC